MLLCLVMLLTLIMLVKLSMLVALIVLVTLISHEIITNRSVLCCPSFEYAACTAKKKMPTVFLQYLVDPKIR